MADKDIAYWRKWFTGSRDAYVFCLAVAAIWIAIAAVCLQYNLLARFEAQSFDLGMKLSSAFYPAPDNVKIIAVDQQSLDYLEKHGVSWPWHRSVYGTALHVLADAGARAAAFDVLFIENRADRPDDDIEFIEALQSTLPVAVAAKLSNRRRGKGSRSHAMPPKLFLSDTSLAVTDVPSFTHVLLPFPELAAAVDRIGNVTSRRDIDGVFRHAFPVATLDGRLVPGLPLALLLAGGRDEPLHGILSPVTKNGRMTMQYYDPRRSFDVIPFAAVFDAFLALQEGRAPELDTDQFKDAYVFVGFTAPGLFDNTPVPIADTYPGVAINATILGNLLDGHAVTEIGGLPKICFVAFWIVAVVLIVFQQVSLPRIVASTVTVFLLFLSVVSLLSIAGYWLACVVPLVCMAGATGTAFAARYATEGRRRRYLKTVFSHYLNPHVIETVLQKPDAFTLGGERREVTIFFSDVQGFTSLSEKLDPETLVLVLNEYLTLVTDILLQSGATLDKYIGDAVMCFWNAPLEIAGHPNTAVETAAQVQRAVGEANKKFQQRYGTECRTRIGIHTGMVTVGNFGSKNFFDYTVIGDAVNLSARLESLNKVFGTSILISADTARHCGAEVPLRPVGRVQVYGKSKSIEVLEAFHVIEDSTSFSRAYDCFYAGDIEAAYAIFTSLPNDPVAQAYTRRIEREGLLSRSADFDPVWVLDNK